MKGAAAWWGGAALGWCSLWAAGPPPAQACEPPPCPAPAMLPASGHIPSNAPALALHAMGRAEVQLQERTGGALLLPVEVRVQPGAVKLLGPLRAGAEYHLEARDECGAGPFTGRFEAGPAAPPPTRLGTLVAIPAQPGALSLAHTGGACSESLRVFYVDVAVELADEARPWLELLQFETWVDGRRWQPTGSLPSQPAPWSSWIERGRDRIYASCAEDPLLVEPGLAPGPHQVQMRARIAGVPGVVETPPVRITLPCPEQGDVFTGDLDIHWLEWLAVAVACAVAAGALALRLRKT